MSQNNNLHDHSEFYESLQCVKLNKKKKDKNWVPLILPLGCPGQMLAEQLKSLYSWISRTGYIFKTQAEITEALSSRPTPCNVTDAELNYIDASFVLLLRCFVFVQSTFDGR